MNDYHEPVLLEEVLGFLKVGKDKRYIDATIGGGGHAFEILRRGGSVLGIDQDRDAIEHIKLKIESLKLKIKLGEDLVLVRGNFRDIEKIAHSKGFDRIAGVIFDFGVSSHQINLSNRGFSFVKDEPLDMRMDESRDFRATEIVNTWPEVRLVELFERLGEEHFSKQIARAIIDKRSRTEILTSKELADVIVSVAPKAGFIHPATKVFQAIRIEVNDELEAIKNGVNQAIEIVERGGRIVAISFHSLEDRLIKRAYVRFEQENKGRIITKKAVVASDIEIKKNKRSRSAKLRVFEVNSNCEKTI